MKIFGLLSFLVGVCFGGVSLFLDTTNGTGFNNVGLLFAKFENIAIAVCFVLVGVILYCTASIIDELRVNRNNAFNTDNISESEDVSRQPGSLETKVRAFGEKLNDYQIK